MAKSWMHFLLLCSISLVLLSNATAQNSTIRQTPESSSQLADRIHRVETEFSPARQMLMPQIDTHAATPWREALGFFIDKKNPALFAHNGWNWAFQGIVVMLADKGKGVAIMTNSNNGFALSDRLISSVAREYGWKCDSLDPNGGYLLFFIASARGGKAAIQKYRDLKAGTSPTFVLDESTLDQVGQSLLDSGKTEDAVEVLRANAQEYPNSADVYARLGEAYMRSGQKALAVQSYEECLGLDPKKENAIEALRNLKQQK